MEGIGKYRFVRRIGAGDYSEVLLCESGGTNVAMKVFSINDPSLNRMVATSGQDIEARLRQRFVTEAKLVKQLQHPNIVRIIEISELADGRPCFVMPYLPGSLRAELFGEALRDGSRLAPHARARTLSVDRTVAILRDVLAGLDEVHKQGLEHRDLKPEHVRFDADGNAVLFDFGVAKTPWAGFTPIRPRFGTKPFMSPEQAINSGNVDARSDVFSVGAIAYLMVTGRLPATPPWPVGDLAATLPLGFGEWVTAAMQREADHLPANASVLRDLLDKAPSPLTSPAGASLAPE